MKFSRRKKFFFSLLILAGFFYFGIFRPATKIYRHTLELKEDFRYFKDGVILQNLPQMQAAFSRARKRTAALRAAGRFLVWLKFVPYASAYFEDFDHLSLAAAEGLTLGENLLTALTPVAPYLGFFPEGEKKPLSGQERLAGLVEVAPVLARNYESLVSGLQQIKENLDQVDSQRYPEELGNVKIRPLLSNLKEILGGWGESREELKDFLELLPELLGAQKPKNYLVLFQNDKELRPTGGFWTAYALFRLERGRIVSIQAGDIYFLDIDNRVPFYPAAPEVVRKYLKLDKWYIRDTNLSPDFRASIETFNVFWARVPGVPATDGVIAIDTAFVKAMIGLLGEIKIPNYETFTKENVVYQLELIANILGSREEKRAGRKDIIGILMRGMLDKTFALPSKEYDKLFTEIWRQAERKHLLFYFRQPAAQALVEKYNLGGRLLSFEGDYLHLNDANFAGRKANLYMSEKVHKEVKVRQGWKEIISTVTVDYENTGAYHPDLNTGYRDYVRLYVPRGAELMDSAGSLEPVVTGEELGKTYFAAYIAVDPLKKARLTFTYRLPQSIVSGKIYRLLIQKQPGTDGQLYTVTVGGGKQEFVLDADRLVEVGL